MTDCTAPKHTPTERSYRAGCRCPETVERVRALRLRNWATYRARHGWQPVDFRIVDEVAIESVLQGHTVRLTIRERGIAIAALTERGLSAMQIAQRVGVSQRQVVRYRSGRIQRAAEASLARETPADVSRSDAA